MCNAYLYVGTLFSTYVEPLGRLMQGVVWIGVFTDHSLGKFSEDGCTYCSNIGFHVHEWVSKYENNLINLLGLITISSIFQSCVLVVSVHIIKEANFENGCFRIWTSLQLRRHLLTSYSWPFFRVHMQVFPTD